MFPPILQRFAALAIALAASSAVAAPSPPSQPMHGPGSSELRHAGVIARLVDDSAQGFWLFTPTDPAQEQVYTSMASRKLDQLYTSYVFTPVVTVASGWTF